MMVTHGRTRRSIGGKRLAVIIAAVVIALVAGALTWGYAARGPDVRTVALSQSPQGGVLLDPSTDHAFFSMYSLDPATRSINPDARLGILNVRTGRLIRAVDLGLDPQSMAIDARRKTLFIIGNGSTLFRISTRTGRVLSTRTILPIVPWLGNMVIDGPRDRVYIPQSSSGANLNITDAYNGVALHQVWFGRGRYFGDLFNVGDIAVDRGTGHVLIAYADLAYSGAPSTNDGVVLIDPNGRILRILTLGRFPGQQSPGSPSLAIDSVHSRAVILDPNTGRAAAIETRDGRTLNAVQLGARNTSIAQALISSSASWGLDEQAGRLLIPMTRRVVCRGSGHCVPTGPHGRLYLLDTRTGRVLRRLPISADDSDVTFDARDRCFLVGVAAFGARMSALYIVDAATGATLHRIPLGRDTLYPILDPGTGRFYLATTHGTISLLDVRAGRTVSSLTVPAAAMVSQGNQRSQGVVNLLVLDRRVIVLRDTSGIAPPDPLGWLPDRLRRTLPWLPPRPRAVPGTVSIFDAPH